MAGIVAGIDERVKNGNEMPTYVVRGRREVAEIASSNYEDADNVENCQPKHKQVRLSLFANSTNNYDGKSHDSRNDTLIEGSSVGYGNLYHVDATGAIFNQRQSHLEASGVRIVDWSSMSNVMEESVAEAACQNCTLLRNVQNKLEESKIRIQRLEEDVEFYEEENRFLRIENQQLKAGNCKPRKHDEPMNIGVVRQVDERNLSNVPIVDNSAIEVVAEENKGDSDARLCNLKADERIHSGARPYKCSVCARASKKALGTKSSRKTKTSTLPLAVSRSQVKKSQASPKKTQSAEICPNGGNKKHTCNYWDMAFVRTFDKNRHELTHTGEKPFRCDVCEVSFGRLAHQTADMRTHTGEKPFKCKFCLKSFTQLCHKITHERCHTEEKPYNCNLCNASFARPDHKTSHMRTHTRETPFQWDECNLAFSNSSNKVRHMRIHNCDKPYHCQYCDKQFNQSSILSRHLRIHTNQRPYACSVCTKAFNHSSTLRRHEKTHRN